MPTLNDKKACVRSQNTKLSLKFMTFKNTDFECLFTLCILGLEAYLIETSFFFKKGSFYHRRWSMENVNCPERL